MAFTPQYTVTTDIIRYISRIEISRYKVVDLPITAEMMASLRESARLLSTHHSTAIEGNLLSALEVNEVIKGGGHFPHREKDEGEVRNYYRALEEGEKMAAQQQPIKEKDLMRLHGIAFMGKNKATPYRDGQNVIRSGKLIVYIPPKAEEVPLLMADLVQWIQKSVQLNLPVPFIAALAHYQFATIHPYYDGNGRTARLLATLILHKYGYDLKGIYCLEEYYAKNLQGYYKALTVGGNEDYYEGDRATADLTSFLEYFMHGMAEAFDKRILSKLAPVRQVQGAHGAQERNVHEVHERETLENCFTSTGVTLQLFTGVGFGKNSKVSHQAKLAQSSRHIDQSPRLRELNPKQRQSLQLFLTSKEITSKDIAIFFNYSERQARYLCQKWTREGFLEIADGALKSRRYRLRNDYEELVKKKVEND